jgi:hypothetical protein
VKEAMWTRAWKGYGKLPNGKQLLFAKEWGYNLLTFQDNHKGGCMPAPEAIARQNIDAQLTACGWTIQNRSELNLPEPGVLAREIMEELKVALEQFSSIAEELGGEEE